MKAFTANSWFEVHGHLVAEIRDNPYLPELWEPNDLRGQEVLIDGTQFLVTGVETFCNMRSPEHPYRHSFGLMVETADTLTV